MKSSRLGTGWNRSKHETADPEPHTFRQSEQAGLPLSVLGDAYAEGLTVPLFKNWGSSDVTLTTRSESEEPRAMTSRAATLPVQAVCPPLKAESLQYGSSGCRVRCIAER